MTEESVERHYGRGGLLEAIRAGLAELGKDPEHLEPADLAAIDEFHVRGRQATLELGAAVEPKTGKLTFTGHYAAVGNPSHIVFLDLTRPG